MKKCNTCQGVKELSCFTKDVTTPDGLYRTCMDCKRQKARARYKSSEKVRHAAQSRGKAVRDRNNVLTMGFKTACGCGVCGENSHVGVLDFHHIDPTSKEFGIGGMISMSIDRIITEMRKCVVLCANCHRKVHLDIIDVVVDDIHYQQQLVLESLIVEHISSGVEK